VRMEERLGIGGTIEIEMNNDIEGTMQELN
jgi:hypothetical protein